MTRFTASRTCSYTSATVQNEMISIIQNSIQEKIVGFVDVENTTGENLYRVINEWN